MALRRYQNQNGFSVGIMVRSPTGDISRWIVPAGGIVELENDATRTRCFNPSTRALVPLSTMTDIGAAVDPLTPDDDPSTWPMV